MQSREERAGCNPRSAAVLKDRGWGAEARTPGSERKSRHGCCCTVREATCARGTELRASFLHKLVSHSMGATDCSMAAPGPMLSLCQDLTSLDYHHNIHQLSYMQTPRPHPHSLLASLPLPVPYPQVQSLQLDPLWLTPPPICLIISPLAILL